MRKKVFCSETEMQQWLSRLLHKETDTALADLILNAADYGSETVFDGLDWKSNKIIESYKWCLESLYTNEIIVENENKETILDLTPEIKTGMLTVDEKCRYFLIL